MQRVCQGMQGAEGLLECGEHRSRGVPAHCQCSCMCNVMTKIQYCSKYTGLSVRHAVHMQECRMHTSANSQAPDSSVCIRDIRTQKILLAVRTLEQ